MTPDEMREAALASLHEYDCWGDDEGNHDDCIEIVNRVLAVVAPALEAAERKITMQREVIDTGQRVEYGQVRHIAAIEHELAEAQAELEAAQAENERLRQLLRTAFERDNGCHECIALGDPDLADAIIAALVREPGDAP